MKLVLATALVFVPALAVPAAENKFDPDAGARAVAPYLDELTVAVAHVDLTRVDADAWISLAKLVEVVSKADEKVDEKEIAGVKKDLQRALDALVKARARDAYAVFSLADLGKPEPYFVIPLPDGADGQAVKAAVGDLMKTTAEKIGDAIVAGSPETLKRLRDLKSASPPDLAQAFAGAGNTAVQVAFVPSKDMRRVVAETLPRLPAQMGGGPTTVFTQGARWVALGIDLPPRLSLRLVIQCSDTKAARELDSLVVELCKHLAGLNEVHELFPGADKLLPLLSPKVAEDRLILTLDDKSLTALAQPLLTVLSHERQSAERSQSMNCLKQIALGLHSYHSDQNRFPAAAIYSKDGKPLLSWRVQILPYINEEKLYKEFHLDEPWDSEHNKKLVARMPAIYAGSNRKLLAEGKTTYLAPVGKETMFPPGPKGVRLADVTDGTSNTIFMVEADADHAVVWTKPEDLKYDPKKPRAGLAVNKGGFLVVFADGSVQILPASIDLDNLRGLFTRAGGEKVSRP